MSNTTIHYELINPIQFILSGKAYFICHNIHTNNKYRYKVLQSDSNKQLYFVSVYIETEYKYIGIIKTELQTDDTNSKPTFIYTHKSKLPQQHPAVKGIQYIIEHTQNNTMPTNMKLYHIGKCGRCGRTLTTKEAIIKGYGSECIKHINGLK
jgi:hypothetical protein